MKHLSPLRYPGGKAGLTPFLTDVIDLNDLRDCAYFEPYAGGAGAALSLLRGGVVSSISINDADQRIFAFWKSVLNEAGRFIDRINTVALTLDEWRKQRAVCESPEMYSEFDVGFSAFYMNRCNRSGVLRGGPIGGYEQRGEWRLDVRFTRDELAARIMAVSKLRDRISISGLDAVTFLSEKLPKGNARKKAFVYLDPPYVIKGQRLYMNSYEPSDHGEISKYVSRQKLLPWLMSYDDAPLIRELYRGHQLAYLPIRYSLQEKRSARELIIVPNRIRLPRTLRVGTQRSDLREISGELAA